MPERFYAEAFGLEVLIRNEDRVWLGTLDDLAARLRRHGPVRGSIEHPGGDRSLYVKDPEGNVVEVWGFFGHGEGRCNGVEALA